MSARLAAVASSLVLAACADAAVAADGGSRDSATRHVVREWSRLLNTSDEAAVARLFALPAIVEQGSLAYRLRTRAQVALWHRGLPCAGRIVAITVRGRFATAVFVLGTRPGHRCDGPGEKAAARFEIVEGKIVHWAQVPVPTGSKPATPATPSGPVA